MPQRYKNTGLCYNQLINLFHEEDFRDDGDGGHQEEVGDREHLHIYNIYLVLGILCSDHHKGNRYRVNLGDNHNHHTRLNTIYHTIYGNDLRKIGHNFFLHCDKMDDRDGRIYLYHHNLCMIVGHNDDHNRIVAYLLCAIDDSFQNQGIAQEWRILALIFLTVQQSIQDMRIEFLELILLLLLKFPFEQNQILFQLMCVGPLGLIQTPRFRRLRRVFSSFLQRNLWVNLKCGECLHR